MRGLQLLLVAAAWCPVAMSKHLKHHLRSDLSASEHDMAMTACDAVTADGTSRPGVCKTTAACRAERKLSVPGFCPGKAAVQCCVTSGAGAAAAAAGGSAAGAAVGGAAGAAEGAAGGAAGSVGAGGAAGSVGAGGGASEESVGGAGGGAVGAAAGGASGLGAGAALGGVVGAAGGALAATGGADAYANALPPTCPVSRQAKTVCKEIHGHTGGCADVHDMTTCPAECVTSVKRLTFGGQTSDWVCQPERPPGGTKRGYMSDDRTSPTRDTPPAITRAQIIDNAVAWINNRVRYSQKRSHGNPAYRTDCTGFVSMSLGLPLWGTTGFVRGCLAWTGDKTIERTPCKSMLPGDAMVSQGHVVLFRKWTNQALGKMELWEEKGTAYGTVVSHNEFTGFAAMADTATDGIVHGRGQYFCFKRKNISP
jgi:hypothetical protein